MRKRDWKPIANALLKNRSVILHTDGARVYRMKVPGVMHDNVVHKKKKVMVKGKEVWVRPKYVVIKEHWINGRLVKVKAGTQIIDRFWQSLRAALKNHSSAKVNSMETRNLVRKAQWQYWNRGEDLWACAADMFQRMR